MSEKDSGGSEFGFVGFVVRLLFAIVIVVATYNPSRHSFAHWLTESVRAGSVNPFHAVVGVLLLIGWVVFVRVTWISLGPLGLLLCSAFLAAVTWALVFYGLLRVDSASALVWVALLCVAVILAVGMSWGHFERRASGQVPVDEQER